MKKLLFLFLFVTVSMQAGKKQQHYSVKFSEMLMLRTEKKLFNATLSISRNVLAIRKNLGNNASCSESRASEQRCFENIEKDIAKFNNELNTYLHLFRHLKKSYSELE